jgi:hypothetical protein
LRGDAKEQMMANERNEGQFGDGESGEDQKEFRRQGEQGQTGPETRTSGQPLGGNESNTGTGTTMTQGFSSSRTGTAGAAGGPGESAGGFVGSQGSDPGEGEQDRDPQQAGFAEQGRGAPREGGDVERGGERTDNFDSDVEGGSTR